VRAIDSNPLGDIFLATAWGVFRSMDNGETWEVTGFIEDVDRLIINASGHIFVGTELDGIFRSTDNGDTWSQVFLLDFMILSFAINSKQDVFAGAHAIYRSTDNGDHWTLLANGPINTYITSLAINSDEHIFTGTAGFGNSPIGAFLSTDDGENWRQIDLTDISIFSLAIAPSGRIFAGTDRGVFRSAQTSTSVPQIAEEIPRSFSLEQSYPNPFNPITTIEFSLPHANYVILRLYSSRGEEIKTLVSKPLSAGKHKIEWDATGFASGLYFYSIRVGEFSETKKLILLK
jgi:photosystem II stability/assembly factor-like uncharacterized protein